MRSLSFARLLAGFAAVLTLAAGTAHAQTSELVCATTSSGSAPGTGPLIRVAGPFHALVLFIRFRDDTSPLQPEPSSPTGLCGPDDWPATDAMPVVGDSLLDPAPTPPFYRRSLTQFFHQSSNGRFTLYGEEVGYVTALPENSYFTGSGSSTSFNMAMLVREAMDAQYLNGTGPIDFADYDADGNGFLDHVFVVIRQFNGSTGHGILCGAGTGGGCASGVSGLYVDETTTTRYGIKVSGALSGSINQFQVIDPLLDNIEVLSHEIGHDIWTQGGVEQHLLYLKGNGLPAIETNGMASPLADNNVAYALMLGSGSGDIRGDRGGEASVAERYHANPGASAASEWVACPAPVSGQTYTMVDQETGDSCVRLPLGTVATTARSLFLSNVQRTGAFNQAVVQPVNPRGPVCNTCINAEGGLPTTGLMIEAVGDSTASGNRSYWLRDIVLADNQLSVFANNPICDLDAGVGQTLSEIGNGDYWRPGVDRQLTPWTRPNVYAYNRLGAVPASFLAAGLHAIDDIRAGTGTAIQFDYHANYNQRPVAYVRENWWIGNEIAGLTFNEVRVQSGATLTVTSTTPITFNGDLVVEAGGRLVVSPGATLRFAPGKRVIVYGTFEATGNSLAATTLTATGPDGWGGIHVGPAPGAGSQTPAALAALPPAATLSGVTVSGVRYLSPLLDDIYQPYASVEVVNRRVVITNGTRILGSAGSLANGVRAIGASAQVVVAGGSEVRESDGVGIYAIAGARVFVTDGAFVQLNSFGGLYLHGYGTRADVDGQAQVVGNAHVGIIAESQAHARIRADGTVTATSVSQNRGGPTALAGGSVDAGQCTPTNAGIRPNHFVNNHQNGASYDARAEGGSTVAARYAWWNGRTALVLVKDKSSTTAVFPVAPTATSPDPACPTISSGRGTAPSVSVRLADEAPTEAGRGENVTAAVVALAGEARQAAWDGDVGGAFALLDQAAQAATTEDDREAVYEAVGALVAAADSALDVSAVVSSLEATAGRAGADRPWARRALGVAYASTARAAEAAAVADALTNEEAGTAHAVFGHGLRVRLAVEADSAALAVDRLSAFAAVVVETDTVAVEAFASSLALVAASFPEADLSGVTGGTAGRGTSSGATAQASVTGREAFVDELSVYPNPASGRGTVRVSVSEPASSVTASVYDALGRRVAVLHDGPLAAGSHDFALDVSRLAPGVYVVEVRVSPEAGAAWTDVRRVTVAR